jgi:hypothetical protein
MSEARLPVQYRDSCAHLLIPLNRCRQAEYYLPWKCEVRNWISRRPNTSPTSREARALWPTTANQIARTRDIPTRSASTTSLRSAWPRWTSFGLPRTVPVATKAALCVYVCAVRTAAPAAGYVHRRYTETAHGLPFWRWEPFRFCPVWASQDVSRLIPWRPILPLDLTLQMSQHLSHYSSKRHKRLHRGFRAAPMTHNGFVSSYLSQTGSLEYPSSLASADLVACRSHYAVQGTTVVGVACSTPDWAPDVAVGVSLGSGYSTGAICVTRQGCRISIAPGRDGYYS